MPSAAPTFDLQSHSTASDGSLAPGDVVRAAHAAGVELLALTDHDTVDGVSEALNVADDLDGIAVIPAAEISALDGAREDLHICGYLLDHDDRDLLAALESWRADRRERARRMIEALRRTAFSWTCRRRSPATHRSAGRTSRRPCSRIPRTPSA